mgnify:CR=1 FL=1
MATILVRASTSPSAKLLQHTHKSSSQGLLYREPFRPQGRAARGVSRSGACSPGHQRHQAVSHRFQRLRAMSVTAAAPGVKGARQQCSAA